MPRPDPANVRARTLDRGPPGARTQVHTVGQIGPKRKLRPDGSLLCEDVPIARTGPMMYRPGEVPIKPPTRPGAAPVLYITRDAETLFAPETLGSAVGAAITLDHPTVDVTPENWKSLAGGFVLDTWQGVGDEANLMFADLVITDRGLIHKVNTEQLREVSLGYSADYEQTGDGEGRQRNIIINHLALVERGRCGPRCAIGDRETLEGEDTMPRTTDGRPADAGGARPRNRLNDIRNALEELEQQQEEDGVHVHVHMPANTHDRETIDDPDAGGDPNQRARTDDAITARIDTLEEGLVETRGLLETILERLPAAGAGNPPPPSNEGRTGDSAALQTSFQQMLADAEILVPGFRAPTFDSALPRAKTVDHMCATRRQVLSTLATTKDGATLLSRVTDEGFSVTDSDCASVSTVFKAAAALKATQNNRAATGDRMSIPAGATASPIPVGGVKPVSAEEINKRNADFWKQ